jgi:NitT/TauT family transport system permease protein
MTLIGTFPSRAALTRPRNRAADVVVFLGAAALLWLIVRVAPGTAVHWTVENAPSSVSTDPAELPYYAVRSQPPQRGCGVPKRC